jgi:hypothetical protein
VNRCISSFNHRRSLALLLAAPPPASPRGWASSNVGRTANKKFGHLEREGLDYSARQIFKLRKALFLAFFVRPVEHLPEIFSLREQQSF